MKAGKIDLNQPVKTFSGEVYPDPTSEDKTSPLTYKTVILNMLGGMKPESGKEAIQVSVLGTHIYKQTGEFDIDQQDYTLLMKAIEQNTPGYIAVIMGQVAGYMEKFGAKDA